MAGDIAVCALLILFCLFCLFNLMFGMGNVMDYDPMGPRAWPVFLLVLLIALLALNIFLSLRAARRQTAALSTAALYILFSRFLQVPLPRGYGMFRDLSLFFETL